jgi:predicted DNA-binding transcriptional regulator AlpA
MATADRSVAQLLRESEAAELLSLKVATLRRWRWSGDGPGFVKLGSSVRYRLSDIEDFIESGRRRSTSDPGITPGSYETDKGAM